jgi:hypothetical protein
VIAEQRKLLQAKETMLQKYMQQFCELTANYQNMIDSHYTSGERAFSPPHNAFDDCAFDVAPQPPDNAIPAQDFFEFQDIDQTPEFQGPTIQNEPLSGRRMFQSSISFGVDEPAPVKKLPPMSRPAMEDHFAQPAQPTTNAPAFESCGLSVDQLRTKVDDLSAERAELERRLNKALPKGKVMSHLMREREEVEVRFNEVSKTIARIKLEIRRAGA